VFLGAASLTLAIGVIAWFIGATVAADVAWAVGTLLGIGPAAWWVWSSVRRGRVGADVIALLALVGTLLVGEYLAGAVITVMLATGRTLEARATAKARKDLRQLRELAPRLAHRVEGAELVTVPLDQVIPGELLLVQRGEIVPVDGRVEEQTAVLDESTLTGEPLPSERGVGDDVRSGAVNAGRPFTMRATRRAADSTYAGIVHLVTEAEANAANAPFVRLADRYAGGFLVISIVSASLAWAVSGDPVRAVAVLVVATPCPLILAAPIAITGGLARAAAGGVLVKGGAALERLAGAHVLLLDKTGTLTAGRPVVAESMPIGAMAADELLRLAASLDQVSPHVAADAIVRAAYDRGVVLSLPSNAEEVPGAGIRGDVDSRRVAVGKAIWVAPDIDPRWAAPIRRRADVDGALTVFVTVDGTPAGALLLRDPIRADAARTIRRLRHSGITRVVMTTGDRADVAESVGAVLGVDAVLSERTPLDKVEAVAAERANGSTMMVGDGINDAPALAAADVGVAMGARGGSAATETADVVLSVDRLDRLGDAMSTARRAGAIARQSVLIGIGLSLTAMAFAGFGFLAPAAGALLQEGIDAATILNALRARRDERNQLPIAANDSEVARRFATEHELLRPELDRIRLAAEALAAAPGGAIGSVRAVYQFLVQDLLPHEAAEDSELYPLLDRILGGQEPTATMSRAHVEIARLIRRVGRVLEDIEDDDPDPVDVAELRRLLYGLHAIVELHFDQEEEDYFSLLDASGPSVALIPPPRHGSETGR
jgi:heavy metal translocating P-type ATPase